MKWCFNIVKIETSMDMGIGGRIPCWIRIDGDELAQGRVFEIFNAPLTVVSLDERSMKFTYRNNTYVIDRYWQVLGTPEHSIPNERIAEWGKYVFHFSRDKEEVCDWSDKHLAELVSQIESNNDKGEFWRNIPLVREFIHELKDVAPFRSDAINPAYKAHYIQRLLSSGSVVRTETPRLYHSLSELYRLYIDYKVLADYDEFLNKNFDEYFFRDVDIWIYNFSWIVNYPSSDTGKECWNTMCRMLKADPVQMSPEWEEVIYDVEREVDEKLKDETRGMGFCFGYWSAKRAALEKRGIQWRSPASMNPRVMFD